MRPANSNISKDAKKIKGYIQVQQVRWIKELARKRRITPNELLTEIIRAGIWPGVKYSYREADAAATPPDIRMELAFYADKQREEDWEYFKIRGKMTSDAQAIRLVVRKAYQAEEDKAKESRQTCLFD